MNRNIRIVRGNYEQCGDVDIVVITAGAPPKQGQTRLDTLELSAK
ncbi:malate/lactate dehydrogenase [Clostridium beijerinckii]|nr:malate/lactate dehydrogenase [Clostridium beijerinckii]